MDGWKKNRKEIAMMVGEKRGQKEEETKLRGRKT